MSRTRFSTIAVVFVALCSLSWSGCGPNRPETTSISGKVTYLGKPVTTGRIVFHPEDGRRPAMAAIEADGSYTLTTFDSKDGAFLGKHRVTIKSTRTVGGPAPDDLTMETEAVPTELPTLEWLVPEKYSRKNTTPLVAEVTADTKTFNFDLPVAGK